MAIKEENETQQYSNKRNILVREDLEYSAQKIFSYSVVGLAAVTIYATFAYLLVQQLKK